MRRLLGRWLRQTADIVDPEHAVRIMHLTLTMEEDRGFVLRQDGRGLRVMYAGEQYEQAWLEADRPPPRIDWTTMTVVRYPGTQQRPGPTGDRPGRC